MIKTYLKQAFSEKTVEQKISRSHTETYIDY